MSRQDMGVATSQDGLGSGRPGTAWIVEQLAGSRKNRLGSGTAPQKFRPQFPVGAGSELMRANQARLIFVDRATDNLRNMCGAACVRYPLVSRLSNPRATVDLCPVEIDVPVVKAVREDDLAELLLISVEAYGQSHAQLLSFFAALEDVRIGRCINGCFHFLAGFLKARQG